MTTQRLTSFTDGVIAVIITVMVLELPVPRAAGMGALRPLTILFVVYALSFVKVGIYWSQHHNVLQASKRVNGQVLLDKDVLDPNLPHHGDGGLEVHRSLPDLGELRRILRCDELLQRDPRVFPEAVE